MKRFLIKVLSVVLPFIILLFVLNFIYKHSYYWTEEREESKFNNVPDNIQLANLGSSHGDAFYYEPFEEYVSFNFNLQWQHHIFNYYILKQYADNFAPNAVLLIPISYFNITRIEKENNFRYYTFLNRDNIPGWKFHEYLLYKCFPLFSKIDVWKKLLTMNTKMEIIPKTTHSSKEITELVDFYANWWLGNDSNVEKGEEGFQYNIEAVSKIIDLCMEKDIVPVLVSTPIMDCLNERFAKADFFETFYRFTDVLKQKYTDIIYLDYSDNIEYSTNYSLFNDPAHLNIYGEKKFTAQIMQDLKDANLLQ